MNAKKAFMKVCVLLGVCALIAGCSGQKDTSEVLVSISGENITINDFDERIANLPERYRDIVKKRKKEYLEEFINDTILYQEALRSNLQKDKDVKRVIEEAQKKILIARLLKDKIDDKIKINETEVEAFYNENSSRYMTPEVMRVSHILVSNEQDAEDILAELKAGASFQEMAKLKSLDPTAQRGGDVGYFPKGQLMPEFENACNGLEVGEISGVVKTKLGYHIIMLTDRKPPQARPLEQVESDVISRLRAMKRQELFNKMLKDLREKADIKINEEALSTINSTETEKSDQ